MAITRLVIRKDQVNAMGRCTVFVTYTHHKCIYFSCKVQIEPRYWDQKKCKVRKTHPNQYFLNQYLQKSLYEVEQARLRLELQGIEPTTSKVRDEFSKPKTTKNKPKTFNQCKQEFLLHKKEIQKVSPSMLTQLRIFFMHLEAFENHWGRKIHFDRIDQDFYEDLISFYTDERQYSPNTIGSQIKHLKTFLNWCLKKKYHNNDAFKDYKKVGFSPEIHHLTLLELNQLFSYNLSSIPRLERVRDLFILACVTGLRYSDFSRLGPENIVGNFIIIRPNKTQEPLKIPINEYARIIIDRYQGKLPTISNHRMNVYIKEGAQLAQLNGLREITRINGGKKSITSHPLHRIIRSHLARKTFITLSLEKGMTLKDVAAITGHNGTSIQRYIAASEKRLSDQMSAYWKIDSR